MVHEVWDSSESIITFISEKILDFKILHILHVLGFFLYSSLGNYSSGL